jgi:hypothetical protein
MLYKVWKFKVYLLIYISKVYHAVIGQLNGKWWQKHSMRQYVWTIPYVVTSYKEAKGVFANKLQQFKCNLNDANFNCASDIHLTGSKNVI